ERRGRCTNRSDTRKMTCSWCTSSSSSGSRLRDQLLDSFGSQRALSRANGWKEEFQQGRSQERRHHHHQCYGGEKTEVENAGGQPHLSEDQADLAAGDHAHADDGFLAAKPPRSVTGQKLPDHRGHDQETTH